MVRIVVGHRTGSLPEPSQPVAPGAGGDADNYWLHPTQSNTAPTPGLPPTGQANYNNVIGNTTPVGSYAANYYGAFDMGGNVWEWNEAIIAGSNRGLRGSSFGNIFGVSFLRADGPSNSLPTYEDRLTGFRVSQVPGPSSVALLALGGLVAARRRRA